ncbi:MAG: SUMF1/EgtB/PvdO family nonheme iron enzyme [Gemmataceae bacterium]|nr:SUMF1/EgtB/PvdO family nonheme iron enzyme [Gemmataceae bacterium]
MRLESTAQLLDFLQETRLLEPVQFHELIRLGLDRFADTGELVRDLVGRGWLTAYQGERLLLGNASELVLGAYCLLEPIGKGGMGEVFRARHPQLGRLAAVKVIRKEHLSHPDSVLRFHREARAAGQLDHPNIVAVHDAGRAGEIHFLAMEYVEGTDLAHLVKEQGPLPPALACDYIRQAALGLQHAFEHGLVHRDIKPSNLMVTPPLTLPSPPSGGEGRVRGRVKILDFGLARFASEQPDDPNLTPTDQWMGTPDYIAPEQARNSKQADTRADIFSLGCTLFFLLTGRSAFPGSNSTEKLAARLAGGPESVRSVRPQLPAELDGVLARMLARDPDARYRTPAEAAAALEPFGRADNGEAPTGAPVEAAPTADNRARSTVPDGPATNEKPPETAVVPGRQPQEGPPETAAPTRSLPGAAGPSTRRRLAALAGVGVGLAGLTLLLVALFIPESERRPPENLPLPKDEDGPVVNSIGMKLVRIPAGSFLMGSPPGEEDRADDEGPQHKVDMARPFYLGAYEVTQQEYLEVMGANPSHFCATGGGRQQVVGVDLGRFPVENVSWEDAVAFCKALSARAAEQKAGRTYRLPTEAEWEYACRAGTAGPFHFGMALSAEQANFDGKRPYGPAPKGAVRRNPVGVGSFPANAWGLYDMHGNVWEWCGDYYGSYEDKLANNLPERRADSDRVLRGGAWLFAAFECRSARRTGRTPTQRGPYYGFRVVCDAGR